MVFTGVPAVDFFISVAIGAFYALVFSVFYVLAFFNEAGLQILLTV